MATIIKIRFRVWLTLIPLKVWFATLAHNIQSSSWCPGDAGKVVTLVSSPDRLMAGAPPKVGAACQSFLEKNGAKVRLRPRMA